MIFRSLLLLVSGVFFLALSFTEAYPQSSQNDLGVSAQVSPSLSLKVEGGVNGVGRATIITSGKIPFGNVTFSEPQLIGNGDAFLDNQFRLHIEATLKITVVGGGVSQVNVELARAPGAANPFSNLLFSNGIRREDAVQTIPTEPEKVLIRSVLKGGDTFSLRVMGVIEPAQCGTFSETVRINATSTI